LLYHFNLLLVTIRYYLKYNGIQRYFFINYIEEMSQLGVNWGTLKPDSNCNRTHIR